ncbi:hypothetical protein EV12_3069 [Prochlorococcus sp. MIT 0701]|nr:hypothetical protein EV12_3069 [Prochlorococcus sp. MIT 0701]
MERIREGDHTRAELISNAAAITAVVGVPPANNGTVVF